MPSGQGLIWHTAGISPTQYPCGGQPGVHVPCAPWFVPQPRAGQPRGTQGANPAQWQWQRWFPSFLLLDIMQIHPAGGSVDCKTRWETLASHAACHLPPASQSWHSRRGRGLAGSTQGSGGLFQCLPKKAGGELNEGEKMGWGGCLNTRLEKLFLPSHFPSYKLHKVCGKLLACNFLVYSSLSMCPAWDTNLFYCDTLPPQFMAPGCLPHEVYSQGEVPGHQWLLNIVCSLYSPVSSWVGWAGMYAYTGEGRRWGGWEISIDLALLP